MTKDFKGRKILIRKLSAKDIEKAKDFRNYINALIEEEAKILMKKKKTEKQEKEWLKDRVKDKLAISLVAFDNDLLVGIASCSLERERQDHVADFGISVRKEYRGIGLGKFLMKEVIERGERGLKPKFVKLGVFDNNIIAIKLYEKMGFKRVAKIPKYLQYKGRLVDEIIMMKKV